MYIVTSFVFFVVGGLLALMMRAELARPGLQFLRPAPQPNPISRRERVPITPRAGPGWDAN